LLKHYCNIEKQPLKQGAKKRKGVEEGGKAHTTCPDLLLQHPNYSNETYLSRNKNKERDATETEGGKRSPARSASPPWIHHGGQCCCMDPPQREVPHAAVEVGEARKSEDHHP
jgi:hypothetical protein